MSITAQLMSCWDQKVASSEGGPVALSALLAHLLFLAANGGLEFATALADTFGTETFLAAAMVCRVPKEFIEDVSSDSNTQISEGKIRISPQAIEVYHLPVQNFLLHRRPIINLLFSSAEKGFIENTAFPNGKLHGQH